MNKTRSKIYFASDMHLGMHPLTESREREKVIVQWLERIEADAKALWLVGDIFDYWFEYKKVVPRGFIRFIGKLAHLADQGVEINIFPGNHDVWYFDYFTEEIGARIFHEPTIIELEGKTFYISHGDGLTDKDWVYRSIKAMFKSKTLQWLYARLHPNASTAFAQWWSKKSRYSKDLALSFKGEEKEEQILFAKKMAKEKPEIDYFIFGHRHVTYDVAVGSNARAICLGEWIGKNTYGVFDGEDFELKEFRS
ncbi:MAG TPA: UDP-2,3-diacylglucosamine diphosphatase [Bacteroidales bacterium]|nr:UDP-2,3-diacylglucosamine diphosphatase [Bacteroidales bacterium]